MKISKLIFPITSILLILFASGCSKSLLERDKLEADSGLPGVESNLEGVEEKSASGLKLDAVEPGMPGDGSTGSFSADSFEGDQSQAGSGLLDGSGDAAKEGGLQGADSSAGGYEKPDPREFGSAVQGMPGDGSTGSFSAGPLDGSGFKEENIDENGDSAGGYEKPAPRSFGSAEQGMPGNGSAGSFSAEPFTGDRDQAGEDFPGEGSDEGKTPGFAEEPFLPEEKADEVASLPKEREVRSRLLPYLASTRMADIHFAFDKHDLDDKSKAILRENAAYLKSHLNSKIEIQGHCDERGSNRYNISLGERRAQSTKSYIVSLGIDKSRIRTVSYGEEKPFCLESNEQCWFQNRRAHFLVAE
ncbi:MAG: hypothetical protein NPINA01_18530 [Nitrospinaceae bacterium]|nr:MAG: hypothetical protein NPINA01_18530 [Nitrospinaceae bacterium]